METTAVIGLGYVGLPLAVAFGQRGETIAFDVDAARVEQLRAGHDRNGEVSAEELRAPWLRVTSDPQELARADIFIVAVPTPVDNAKRPDMTPLLAASRTIGAALTRRGSRGLPAIVVFESTVYPGCTEEVCVPELERAAKLRCGADFAVGYSPERINPGDRDHTFERVVKIVAGMDAKTTERLAAHYGAVVKAGVHKAPDIRTAEAAKVIENTQRDLNIALMNELSMLFHRLGIDTTDVLNAAGTKWNFLPFRPGLVGGHCIPVDPYYLTHKAEEVGYIPQVILAGRRINDGMPTFVAQELVKLLSRADAPLSKLRVLVLGLTFKENVRDVRNSLVFPLIDELRSYGLAVHVHDPGVDVAAQGLTTAPAPWDSAAWDAVILAVPHGELLRPAGSFAGLFDPAGPRVLMDLKGVLDREELQREGVRIWRL